MASPMQGIIFVACANADYFHGDGTEYFLRYIIYAGTIFDEPTLEQTQAILDECSDDILLIISPCATCKLRGIKGPRGYKHIERQ